MDDRKNQLLISLTSAMKKAKAEFKTFLRMRLKENKINLTYEMLEVLLHLWVKDGVSQQELANVLHKGKASLTYLIDNLSKRNLVERAEDANDRRNKIITVLPEGMRLKNIINPWIDQMYVVAGKDISTEMIHDSIILFDKLQENLKQIEQ
jgi:DNA-binding MarR family transcriptional regulator